MANFCSRCGKPARPGARFCIQCGGALGDAGGGSAAPRRRWPWIAGAAGLLAIAAIAAFLWMSGMLLPWSEGSTAVASNGALPVATAPANPAVQVQPPAPPSSQPATNPADPATWRLVPEGFGPARIGMTPEQVSAALGRSLSAPEIQGQCDDRTINGLGLRVQFVGGRLFEITNMNDTGMLSENGPTKGSSVEYLRQAYGVRLINVPHSLGRVFTKFVVYGNDRDNAISFYVTDGVVQWVTSGGNGDTMICGA